MGANSVVSRGGKPRDGLAQPAFQVGGRDNGGFRMAAQNPADAREMEDVIREWISFAAA